MLKLDSGIALLPYEPTQVGAGKISIAKPELTTDAQPLESFGALSQEIVEAFQLSATRSAQLSAELQFHVDSATKTLTVALVDRETGQVITTIPRPLLKVDTTAASNGIGTLVDDKL